MTSKQDAGSGSRWLAFQHRGYSIYWCSRLAALVAVQVLSVSVGWQVYDLTRDPLDLGIVGLIQFVPSLALVLVTGTVSDRYSRRLIMALCMTIEAACALALLVLSFGGLTSVMPVFAVLAVFGTARAFLNPAASSLITNLVPTDHLANAVAWNSSSWQLAVIVGPVAGGLLYGLSPLVAYSVAFILLALGTVLILLIAKPQQRTTTGAASWDTLLAGFRYVWRAKVVLGAISLDLFAVLLGGATALMPVYARDILELGPLGLGLLRAAPGLGAIAMVIYLTTHPIRDAAGVIMFVFVAGFGFFTVIFGVSTIPWVSIAALVLMGACDMVSVYIRETLIQIWTPDDVRGRVNAVNMVFVGASNELGEFRAGVMAALIGTVWAVTLGGAGTMAVAGLWSRWFPRLRQARYLDRIPDAGHRR